ncbi:MAG TPA: hypothetical protein VGK99_21780 [Acidobacteriota bacterium]
METRFKAPPRENGLPHPAKLYVLCIVALSVPVLGLSVYRSFFQGTAWVYLAGLTVFASLFSVRIPLLHLKSHSLTISVNDAFVFVAILVFSPEVAASIAALEGFTGSLKSGVKRTYKKVFNIGVLSLVTFVVGSVVLEMKRALSPTLAQTSFLRTLGIVLTGGVIYFLLNSVLVAFAIALTSGKTLAEVWRQNFALLWWAYLINAGTAAVMFYYFKPVNWAVLLMVIPLALVIWTSRKISLSRTPQAATS